MASIVPTFEYDIFISYRHNDNRSGWVTEFVNALQEELASTIKEPLTIYFDKNPHDGLLETHNVDKSLEGKLKCLIFIPIISQTYCDTKSFAWQHEFVAFNKLAKEDQFGRDIKLNNGNVASRILPIKIHDLDVEDKTIIENKIGGVLRAIEFIFKSAGVNRPLTANDKREENTNKTLYRDQVNKVANAVKEIVTALKNPSAQSTRTTTNEQRTTKPKPYRKTLITSLAFLCFIAISYFFYQQRSAKNEQPTLDKSIAVLPFADMSPSHDQEYFGDGMAEEIINVLVQAKGLNVIARTSSFQFREKGMDLKEVGKKLGVGTILEGSIRKSSDKIRVTAQLINTLNGSHIWSKTFDRKLDDVFAVQDEIASAIAEAMKTTLSLTNLKPREKWNEEAWKDYQLGRFYYDRQGDGDLPKAFAYFKNSILKDSAHSIVWVYFSVSETSKVSKVQNRKIDVALRLDSQNGDAWVTKARIAIDEYSHAKAMRYLRKALSCPINPRILRNACATLNEIGKPEEAIQYGKQAIELDPLQTLAYQFLSESYFLLKQYDSSLLIAKKGVGISPNFFQFQISLNLIMLRRWQEAENEISKITQEDLKLFLLTIAHFGEGKRQTSDQELSSLMKLIKGKRDWNFLLAELHAFRNESELAIRYLQTAFDQKEFFVSAAVKTDPFLDPLRTDPRFLAILKKFD